MTKDLRFNFGNISSEVHIQESIPALADIAANFADASGFLAVCDANTEAIAQRCGGSGIPYCVFQPGEEHKSPDTVFAVLEAARNAGLGRDGVFLGIGGGLVSDITAFAASVYKRGARLCLVSTSILGMADAAVGGKTGFNLFGVKNLTGTFYPAEHVYMPLEALESLPPWEWKSGMAEIIKTALLEGKNLLPLLNAAGKSFSKGELLRYHKEQVFELVSHAVAVKGRIVEADPREQGSERALLNLGHTFGQALEAAAGLGRISHGEAVAWGIARAAVLGRALGITTEKRVREIEALIRLYGYETTAPHPLMRNREIFMQALKDDKKKKGGKMRVVIPTLEGAELVLLDTGEERNLSLVQKIITGDTAQWA